MAEQIYAGRKRYVRTDRKNGNTISKSSTKSFIHKIGVFNTNNRPPGPNVVAVIPAFNEDRFIGSLVLKTRQYVSDVIVVDDGSKDRTTSVAKMAGAEVLTHSINSGKGQALKTGFQRAKELNADVIVVLDGDGQHRPSEIPEVIRPIIEKRADMVIGSRFRGMKNRIPAWRQFGQHALTLVTNVSSGVSSTDSQSGFRAFTVKTLDAFDVLGDGFSVESEMQFVAAENNLRINEVPITCHYVEKAKRNPVVQGLQVLNGIYKLISATRPLFFFGSSGIAFTFMGLMAWGWILEVYIQTGRFAMAYMLLATLAIILGVLFIFEGLTLNALSKMGKNMADKKQFSHPLALTQVEEEGLNFVEVEADENRAR